MKALLAFFLRQSIALNIIFVAMVIFGAVISTQLIPIEQYPNINMGKFTIRTAYPGATAENVERLVTEQIEEQIREMEGIDYVRSSSLNGMSEIIVQMEDNVDYLKLYDELRIRVLGAQNQLPNFNGDPLTPTFFINDVDEWSPVMQVNLMHKEESPGLDKRPLTLLAKELRTRLEQVPGVKKVQLLGIEEQQYEIAVDAQKLESYGLTLEEVRQALLRAGQFVPGGSINQDNNEIAIVLDDIAYDSNDIASIVVRSDGEGSHITIGSLINWESSGFKNIDGGFISNFNGQDATICKVLKKPMANAATVKAACLNVVEDFMSVHEKDNITYAINLDSTLIIKDSLQVLNNSLFAACILVILSLFWFLSDASKVRMYIGTAIGIGCGLCIAFVDILLIQALVIAVFTLYVFYHSRAAVLTVNGIIFSFLGSLIFFYLFGYSINEVSLLGFVLTIGIIVDDAIITLENIRRHRESGKDILKAAIDGTAEVFWPVVSATLTTMAAFLPMLMMSGSTGQFFALVPIAVSIALLISLLECLVLLPLHVVDLSRLLGDEPIKEHNTGDFTDRPGTLGKLHRFYERLLRWNLNNKIICVLGIGLTFIMAIGILVISTPDVAKKLNIDPPLRIVFFPSDSSTMWVHLRMPANTSLKQTDQEARDIARQLLSHGDTVVDNVTSVSGLTFDSSYNSVPGENFCFIIAELAGREKRSFDNPKNQINAFRLELEERYKDSGVGITVEAKKEGPPTGSPVNIRVHGINEESVTLLANDLLTWMKSEIKPGGKFEGIIDLQHNRELFQSRYLFNFDDNKLANHKLTPIQAQQHIATLFNGAYIGDIRRIDDDVPIRLKIDLTQGQDPSTLLNLPIVNDRNQRVVRFSDIGSIQTETVPNSLVRTNFERSISITGNLESGAIYSPAQVKDWYQQHKEQYPGAGIIFSGEAESTARSFASLWMSFGIAVFLIFGILASQFKSYTQPLIIMSNIMFAFIGVVFVMALFGIGATILGPNIIRPERAWFTVQCFMAVIGLAGLVINDAIVLIDFINQRRAEGMPLQEALITAGHQRMRPIIMTTITTITGLLPMAIGLPEFSVRWSPFATAFIAGIVVSTTMTLLMIPVLYAMVENIVGKWQAFLDRFVKKPEQALLQGSAIIDDSNPYTAEDEIIDADAHDDARGPTDTAQEVNGIDQSNAPSVTRTEQQRNKRIDAIKAALQPTVFPGSTKTYRSIAEDIMSGASIKIPENKKSYQIAASLAIVCDTDLVMYKSHKKQLYIAKKGNSIEQLIKDHCKKILGFTHASNDLELTQRDMELLLDIYQNQEWKHVLPRHNDGQILHTVISITGNAMSIALDPHTHKVTGLELR